MKDKKQKINTEKKSRFFENDFVIFFLGPLIFLVVVWFTGYQIFYSADINNEERKRTVWLLSAGAFFYSIVLIFLIWRFS